MLVESSPVELVPEALRGGGTQRGLRDRALERHLAADEIGGQLASGGDDLEAIIDLKLDDQRTGGDQGASTFSHELQDQRQIRLAANRPRDLDHRAECVNGLLELVATRFQTAVAPRMVDRDPGELRQPDQRPLVSRSEFGPRRASR